MSDLIESLSGRFTLVDDFGQLTPAEFSGEIESFIGELAELNCGPGSSVGLMCRNSRHFVKTFRGARVLGCDLHYLSTEYTAGQIAELAESAGLDLLICDSEFTGRIPAGLPVLVADRQPRSDGLPATPAVGKAAPGPVQQPGRHVIYTSGTEGKPKPIGRSRFASADEVRSLLSLMPIPDDAGTLCAAPLFHAWGLLHLRLAFARGGKLILPLYYDPYEILDLIRQHRPDVIVTVPVVLRNMVDVLARKGSDPLSGDVLGALKVIAVAGSALPRNLVEETIRAFGPRLYSLYGSTEAGWVSVATPEDLCEYPDTAGRPVGNISIVIRDESGSPLSPGEHGRITIASKFSTTAGTETADYLDTGDVGYVDTAARLFVRGRADEMIIVGAENIYPIEIETPMLLHPAVADVAVVSREDDRYGHRLAALVVRKQDSAVTSGELLEWLRDRIPVFKLPRTVEFVDEIPRNAAGKIMRAAMRGADHSTPGRAPGRGTSGSGTVGSGTAGSGTAGQAGER